MTSMAMAAALVLAQPAPTTLSYEEALRQAAAGNVDIQQARARLEQARAQGWKVWSAHLPQISAAATWTHNSAAATIAFPLPWVRQNADGTPAGPAVDPTTEPNTTATPYFNPTVDATIQKEDQLGALVQASVPLVAPGLWFGIAAASDAERAAEQGVEAARREILFGTAQLYYGAVSLQLLARIAERQLAVARDHEKDARVRFQAGSTPKVALLRAEIDRARAEQDLRAAQAGYASMRSALATAMGRTDADFEVAAPDEPAPPPAGQDLEARAARERPDVLSATSALAAAGRARNAVQAGYAPSLGAFARWQWANLGGFTGKQDSWAAGLALSWTIFDGTLREASLKETGARVAEAEAALRGAELRARDEVKRGRLDLDAAVANREKAREQLGLARENQKLVEVNFRAGAATYLEVSDANAQLLTAELASLSEEMRARLAALRLLKVAGLFDPR
jgi:outer membrane protein TolC